MQGKIAFFNKPKGWGIIQCEQQGYFFHATRLRCDEDELRAGIRVTFDIEPAHRGPMAVDVELDELAQKLEQALEQVS